MNTPMSNFTYAFEAHRPSSLRFAPHYRVAHASCGGGNATDGEVDLSDPVHFTPAVPVMLPPLSPTIAPLGRERLIAVRNVRDAEVVVRGAATGREYSFAAMEAREVPLADARALVSGGDFAFSGGR